MKKKHNHVVEVEKKKYPIGPAHYELYEEIGSGVSATVHRALCKPFNENVAIKILDFERDNANLNNISREAHTMNLIDHPNVLKSHCSFVSDHNLWFVMPYMAGGSCLHILKADYPDGFEEVVIATILKEVLKGLEYLHQHGHIHRDIKAGNILIDGHGAIKLGDFGVSACLFDSGDRQRTRNTFVGTPCWMAPEVMEQLHGYDFKADIWSFGITALELAHGHAPFSKYPPMKVLLMTMNHGPPGLNDKRDKKFSSSFKDMIGSCLEKDPSKRPTAQKLLKNTFFRQARSNDYISRKLLEGKPALGDRIKALKIKEEAMLAQERMPNGRMEQISQNEYKRGISGWNFNLDDMKAQASLIEDPDNPIDDTIGCSNSFSTLDEHNRPSSSQNQNPSQIADMDNTDEMQNISAYIPVDDSTLNGTKLKCEDHDSSIASSSHRQDISQDSSSLLDNQVDHNMDEKSNREDSGRTVEGTAVDSHHGRFSISVAQEVTPPCIQAEREKLQHQPQNNLHCIATTVPLRRDDAHSELSSKASKFPVASSDGNDEKKVQIVQQRGRFKVTSENVDLEKADPSSPVLQKDQA